MELADTLDPDVTDPDDDRDVACVPESEVDDPEGATVPPLLGVMSERVLDGLTVLRIETGRDTLSETEDVEDDAAKSLLVVVSELEDTEEDEPCADRLGELNKAPLS